MRKNPLLQELKYRASDECKAAGAQMQSETLIKRPFGPPIHYRCVVNPMKLTDEQWQRVVAVFVQVHVKCVHNSNSQNTLRVPHGSSKAGNCATAIRPHSFNR